MENVHSNVMGVKGLEYFQLERRLKKSHLKTRHQSTNYHKTSHTSDDSMLQCS